MKLRSCLRNAPSEFAECTFDEEKWRGNLFLASLTSLTLDCSKRRGGLMRKGPAGVSCGAARLCPVSQSFSERRPAARAFARRLLGFKERLTPRNCELSWVNNAGADWYPL